MRKENKKEKWSKPKLIILTRGKPEERVLAYCKGGGGLNSNSSYQASCATTGPFSCVRCDVEVMS